VKSAYNVAAGIIAIVSSSLQSEQAKPLQE